MAQIHPQSRYKNILRTWGLKCDEAFEKRIVPSITLEQLTLTGHRSRSSRRCASPASSRAAAQDRRAGNPSTSPNPNPNPDPNPDPNPNPDPDLDPNPNRAWTCSWCA
eukprot:scaffold95564_cov60-Phaeocystis_antarctica.AAC.1